MSVSTKDRIRIQPTGAALGADVIGIDPANPGPEDIAAVKAALRDHLVVRLRGYSISDVEFTKFAAQFGELEGSPAYSRSRSVYVPECPEITIISNVMEEGKAIGEHGDGELNWHSDKGFVERPSEYTFLLGREVPASGGDTSFANMYNAVDRIPAELRTRLADLKLKHQRSHTAQGTRRPGYVDIGTDDPRELPGPQHPILRTHPESGRKALYLGRRFGGYIVGLPLAESERVLDLLWSCAAQPADVWSQQWQTGDLVIWDNRCTMHRRDAFPGKGRRRMHRLTTISEAPY
jgi:taurine dioxygenase